MAKTIWGFACSWAYVTVIGTVELVGATVESVVSDKSFGEALDDWTKDLDSECNAVAKFGDDNAKYLNQIAGTIIGPVVGAQINKRL